MPLGLLGSHPSAGLDALDAADAYDVCIIGSGFSGTILGTELAKAGARTIILESGHGMAGWLFDGRVKGLADYEVSGDADYPTKRTKARLVGGNSNFWTGRCERMHPSDFGPHPYLPKGNPWPIGYRDLEPYYDRAERTLRVRGGELSEHMPPRQGPLPLPATTDLASLKAQFASVGVTVDVAPTATPTRGLRFFRIQDEVLPEFHKSGRGTLVTGVTVTRLLVGGADRRIVGAEARSLDGTVTKTVRARLFVVACGGIETPRLLLLSRSDAFPHGIGNEHDRVGRGFNEHPSTNFYAKMTHSKDTVLPRHRIGRIHQFYETLRPQGLGSIDISVIQSWMFPHHLLPPVELAFEAFRTLSRIRRPTLYMGPNIEMRPVDDNRVTLSRNMRDRFGNPAAHLHLDLTEDDRRTFEGAETIVRGIFDRLGATSIRKPPVVTFGRHHIGTCRMGASPRTSVVDPSLRVHGTPNLYLLGAETFVTGGAVTPTLTIVALAYRLAQRIPQVLPEHQVALAPGEVLAA
jgi:choline dehydrogenase-like flavoprotein